MPVLEGGSDGAPSETGGSFVVVGAEAGASSTSSPSEAEVEESEEATSELPTHSSNHSATVRMLSSRRQVRCTRSQHLRTFEPSNL